MWFLERNENPDQVPSYVLWLLHTECGVTARQTELVWSVVVRWFMGGKSSVFTTVSVDYLYQSSGVSRTFSLNNVVFQIYLEA